MDKKIKKLLHVVQKNELTENLIYLRLADQAKDKNNADVLRKIGQEEKGHARFWQKRSGETEKPDMWRVFRTVWLARLLGLTFVLKLMEKREGTGSKVYTQLSEYFPEAKDFAEEENVHEKKLLGMLDEESLKFVGSIVLGLNDALIELTGALAGFTLALSDTRVISLVGLVTGIAAGLSMAASDYLSSKAEEDEHAKKSALYTGVAYLVTLILLILPFILLSNQFIALGITLAVAVLIIFMFNFYISTAKDLNFKERFFEMSIISLGVAAFSFGLGYVLKLAFGVSL